MSLSVDLGEEAPRALQLFTRFYAGYLAGGVIDVPNLEQALNGTFGGLCNTLLAKRYVGLNAPFHPCSFYHSFAKQIREADTSGMVSRQLLPKLSSSFICCTCSSVGLSGVWTEQPVIEISRSQPKGQTGNILSTLADCINDTMSYAKAKHICRTCQTNDI